MLSYEISGLSIGKVSQKRVRAISEITRVTPVAPTKPDPDGLEGETRPGEPGAPFRRVIEIEVDTFFASDEHRTLQNEKLLDLIFCLCNVADPACRAA